MTHSKDNHLNVEVSVAYLRWRSLCDWFKWFISHAISEYCTEHGYIEYMRSSHNTSAGNVVFDSGGVNDVCIVTLQQIQ